VLQRELPLSVRSPSITAEILHPRPADDDVRCGRGKMVSPGLLQLQTSKLPDMYPTNSSSSSRAPAKSRLGLVMACGIPGCVVAIIAVLFLANWFRDYSRSQSMKQRLTGKWTEKVVRNNGSDGTVIWEFRPDGTVRDYPAGKPPKETGRLDDYLQWNVSGGELVLSWDHHFTREASTEQRLRQVESYIEGSWHHRNTPLAFSDRCLIQDEGGDTFLFTLHPDKTEADAFMPRHLVLTRNVESHNSPAPASNPTP
jgi:hypothetical protein